MGENKAFLPFGDSPTLVQYQHDRLKKMFASVFLSVKDESKFEDLNALVIEDCHHKEVSAPTVGLINAFRQLEEENSFFVLSVDTPFVNEKSIRRFFGVSDKSYDAVIARTPSGIHPLCGIYTRALEEPLKQMAENGEHRLMQLLEKSNVFYVDIEDEDTLLNLNTPQEYQKALAKLKTEI